MYIAGYLLLIGITTEELIYHIYLGKCCSVNYHNVKMILCLFKHNCYLILKDDAYTHFRIQYQTNQVQQLFKLWHLLNKQMNMVCIL